ncbi:MAG TPA: glycosyltransferase [Balneolaceae bacterium]|nr:glycosyltransferase [Balneolaceae bacterium]
MKILVVCSMNRGYSSFIREQVDSLKKLGVSIDVFGIKGKGKWGYLKNIFPLKKRLNRENYDLVHAHYGLSGLLANLQRAIPVVTTYHGSDVNRKSNVKYSKMTAWLSCYNILTNDKLNRILKLKKRFSVIPCGVDLGNFKPMDQNICKREMGLSPQKKYILFSSSFDRDVKNAPLAQATVQQLENTELIELKGYTREQVNLLINASELVLVTSYNETGPLIVKEALACNRPVVSTDVGDVKQILAEVQGSYMVDYNPENVAEKCRLILEKKETYESRSSIQKYELSAIAVKIKDIYASLITEN